MDTHSPAHCSIKIASCTLCTCQHQSTEDDHMSRLCKGMSSWSWRGGPPSTLSRKTSRSHHPGPPTLTRSHSSSPRERKFDKMSDLITIKESKYWWQLITDNKNGNNYFWILTWGSRCPFNFNFFNKSSGVSFSTR